MKYRRPSPWGRRPRQNGFFRHVDPRTGEGTGPLLFRHGSRLYRVKDEAGVHLTPANAEAIAYEAERERRRAERLRRLVAQEVQA